MNIFFRRMLVRIISSSLCNLFEVIKLLFDIWTGVFACHIYSPWEGPLIYIKVINQTHYFFFNFPVHVSRFFPLRPHVPVDRHITFY